MKAETITFPQTENVLIAKQAVIDLMALKEKFDLIVESLELMSNREFMESYQKAREQIKNQDFIEWNKL